MAEAALARRYARALVELGQKHGNVDQLGLAWSLETGFERGHQATPIVVDGVLFVSLPWSVVLAIDARTGETLWRYDPKVPRHWGRRACCRAGRSGANMAPARPISPRWRARIAAASSRPSNMSR